VAALEAGTLTAADLDATARARLSEHPQDSLRRRAAALLGAPTSRDREQVIAGYHGVFELPGDPQRGAAVFKQRCAACHQHQGIGTNVGAQLSALTNKSTDVLVMAILDPNRAVEFKFMAYNVLMNDGRVLSGLIVDESAASLTIAKADGSRDTVLRSEVERLSSSRRSFMPDGLEKDLSLQDLADVISFVQSKGDESSEW
jgi:putative heme-binding domain-containing protein